MSEDFYSKLVEQLVVSATKHLRLRLKTMFTNADTVIAALPESCGFSRQLCSDAYRLLRISQESMSKNYMLLINNRLKPAVLPDGLSAQSDNASELIDQEEVDAMVAITSIHSNAISTYGDSVQKLEARLEYLEITTDSSFDKQSLSPKELCESFYQVLVATGMKSEHISVLLKLYDQTINRELSELYDELNALLVEADVLPNIIMDCHSEDGGEDGGAQTRTANYYDPQASKAEHFIQRSDSEMNYFAANYMNGDMTVVDDAIDLPASFKTAPSYDEIEGKNCYARKDVVVALSKLQQALVASDNEEADLISGGRSVDIGVIKSSLFNSMHASDGAGDAKTGKHVNLLDERSIDFVGMMFDVIADDDIIPPLIKSQLMRLQISVIKVSITDKTLFENDQHPVRSVLNLITEVGQGVVSEDDEDYIKLSTVITKLLKEYYMDITSFKRAEKELKALYSRKEALVKKKEQEEKRKIIKQHARNVVLTELKCLSAKKTIPKAIQPLVLKYLPTLMINQYVQHGRESKQWASSTSLLKRLIQCVQPLKRNEDWLQLKDNEVSLLDDLTLTLCKAGPELQTIQDLLVTLHSLIKDMLLDFGFNNVEDSNETENLSDIVNDMEIIDNSNLQSVQAQALSDPGSDDSRILSSAEKELQEALLAAESKINALPEQVHPGVWFEIYNGEEHAVRRLKLSVILSDTAKVVFSDRRGNTVMEKDAADFTDELAANKSRVIADHSTFDNALGCVIASFVA